MISLLEVGSGGLSSSPGLTVPLSTLLRIVEQRGQNAGGWGGGYRG